MVNCGGFYLWKLPDAPRCSASGGGRGGLSDFGSGENAVPQTYCTVDVPMQQVLPVGTDTGHKAWVVECTICPYLAGPSSARRSVVAASQCEYAFMLRQEY